MTALLEAIDVKVTYASPGNAPVEAVRGVSLTLGPGEVLGVVGESGSGKSSLAKALLGLTPLAAGAVRIEGVSIASASRAELLKIRRLVQPVFQDASSALDPSWRIGQSLEEPLVIHGLSAPRRSARVAELLASVQLDASLALLKPHQLSAGQRQRVNVARAMAVEPRVLVLDEPVSALDLSVQAQLLNLLMQLKRERALALLFITHALDVVAHLADRIAVMHAGQFVEEGTVAQVLSAPTHPFTRQLLDDARP